MIPFDKFVQHLDNLTPPEPDGWRRATCPSCSGAGKLVLRPGDRPRDRVPYLARCLTGRCSFENILDAVRLRDISTSINETRRQPAGNRKGE